MGPECVSASPSETLSHWGDCVSQSVFGQSKDLNLALGHLTLSSWILLGESAEQTPMQFCKSSPSLCFYDVMENKELFVLSPTGLFQMKSKRFFS